MKLVSSTLILVFSGALATNVNLPLGRLEGGTDTTIKGRKFFQFEGVPYAQPPTGINRFREPQNLLPWNDTFVANTITICLQYNNLAPFWDGFYTIQGDEDCLYLNIYTPTLNRRANLDVIVFFHGGAFMFNYAAFHRPNFILDQDVVYVSINYRLGPLGFLSTEDNTVPGNNGIRDQLLALKFIQKYIKYFGGNPGSVTITGASAGGSSVHTHFLSPQSNGLFHRGIARSGTSLNSWALAEKSLQKAQKLASSLGCSFRSSPELVACLRSKPARQIVSAVREFQPWLYNPYSPFGMVVDSYAQNPIFPEHPIVLLKKGRVKNLPIIFSHVNVEGLYPGSEFYRDQYINDLNTRWNELIPLILDYNNTVKPRLLDRVSQRIRQHYLGTQPVSKQNYLQFIQILSDRIFIDAIYNTINLHTQKVSAEVYLYNFTYHGAHSLYERTPASWGAGHYDDTAYIFGMASLNATTTPEDRNMIEFFVQLYTTFARTGKPQVSVPWPTVAPAGSDMNFFKALQIDSPTNVRVVDSTFANAAFWNSLPIVENDKLFQIYGEK